MLHSLSLALAETMLHDSVSVYVCCMTLCGVALTQFGIELRLSSVLVQLLHNIMQNTLTLSCNITGALGLQAKGS